MEKLSNRRHRTSNIHIPIIMTDSTSISDINVLSDIVSRSPPNGISVLVVGSGIGGLTAARECLRVGCSVRAFERRPHSVLTGGSFTIGSSALRSLHNYPRLQREVKQLGCQPGLMVYKLDGSVISGPLQLTDVLSSSVDRDLASNTLRLSRPKLYCAMLEHLERMGVHVEYGREVVDYFENTPAGRAGVIFSDGSRHDADIVIAADGVNGHSWKLVLGREMRAQPSGDAIFRTDFPVRHAITNPIVAEKFIGNKQADGQPMVHIYMGDIQLLAGVYKDTVEWGLVHKDDGRAQESWDRHHLLERVFELVEKHPDLCEEAKALISTAPADSIVDWRIMWRDPQPQWTSASGQVVQLGDAAHTFHPSSGNGATQAMEDAVSLVTCLSIAGKDDLAWATRVHNLLR
ncbi:hypothetical protein DV736_g2481, partial [Chaetothyriales sp. CBS 134916]